MDRRSSFILILGGWLAFVLSASGCAGPAAIPSLEMSVVPWAGDGLVGRQIATPHYMLFSTLRDGKFELAVAKRMELLHDSYAATVNTLGDSGQPLRVFLLETWADYARVMSRTQPTPSTGLPMGALVGVSGRDLVVVATDRAEMLAGMAHHGWHQYVNTGFTSRLPAWLDEGLACEFEALAFAEGRAAVRTERNAVRIATLRELLRSATNAPLSQVVARETLDAARAGAVHYDDRFAAQAWALVSLLRDGAGGKFAGAFDDMLRDVAGGTFGVHAGALALTSNGGNRISIGEAALRFYFEANSTELEDVYFDHLVRLCGF